VSARWDRRHDHVDATNLQRQILHGTASIGRSKLESAAERLHDINPHVVIEHHPVRLTSANALDICAATTSSSTAPTTSRRAT
jgi:molybdopterin/thiamine biosynthesis adenylyltransferase